MDKRLFIAEENCSRLDLFLSSQTEEFTRSRLKKLIDEGKVLLNGKKAKAGAEVKVGDEIELEIPDAV
jgi:23S rRNA pseudouridine1911/1915/1917 synthase